MICSMMPQSAQPASADFWQRVIDCIDVPVFLVASQTGCIIDANRAGIELSGRDSAQLRRACLHELMLALGWQWPPDLRHSLRQAAAGIPQNLQLQRAVDAEKAEAATVLHLTVKAIGDGIGSVVVTVNRAVGSTECNNNSERTLATLMANLPGMAYRSRSDQFWVMEFVSEGSYTLTGYYADEFVNGKRIDYGQLLAREDRPRVVRELVRALEGRRPYQLFYRISCRSSNSLKWVWERGRGVYDRNGKLLYLEGVITDITDQKQTETKFRRLNHHLEKRVQQRTAELEAATMELEAFVYSVSHDLRAPLRAVEGFVNMLFRRFSAVLPAEADEYCRIIAENIQHMNQQIADLRLFSRLGRQALRRGKVEMRSLIDEALQELGPEMQDRRIDWQIAELPEAHADPVLLRQVWVNLLSNALKYTRRRELTVIRIDANIDDSGKCVYRISDNGVGFDMAEVDKIFTVFRRLHSAREYEGTGAGLAIVERIIHRHGGRIWAEAVLEQGACFSFCLEQ